MLTADLKTNVVCLLSYIAMDFLDPTRYKQMSGRAGRAGQDTHGEPILICEQKQLQQVSDLIKAPLQPLQSCLGGEYKGPCESTFCQSLCSDRQRGTEKHLFCGP